MTNALVQICIIERKTKVGRHVKEGSWKRKSMCLSIDQQWSDKKKELCIEALKYEKLIAFHHMNLSIERMFSRK